MSPGDDLGLARDIYRKKYEQAWEKARSLEADDDYENAARYYRECAKYKRKLADKATGDRRESQLDHARQLEELADRYASGGRPAPAQGPADSGSESGGSPRDRRQSQGDDDSEEFTSMARSMVETASTTWEDIAGLDDTKDLIRFSAVTAYLETENGEEVKGTENVLLYGPPGTGKTLLAEATSNNLGATFFNVKLEQVKSKWHGESAKILSSIFDDARAQAPSVLFFDELDTLVKSRNQQSSSGAEESILNTFLTRLQGFESDPETQTKGDSFVLRMAATNAPWDLDPAVLSKFDRKIYIPLPDEPARRRIFEIALQEANWSVDADIEDMADRTEGYSGRAISQICKTMQDYVIRDMNADILDDFDDMQELRRSGRKLKTRALRREDFDRAIEEVNRGQWTTPEALERYRKFGEGTA